MHAQPADAQRTTAASHTLLRDGFLTMLPLWTGAIPTGVAYAVAAHDAGLSRVETALMSLTVFSAASQLGAVALLGDGVSPGSLVMVALALNIHLLLFGLAVARAEPLPRSRQALVAFFLTDGAFGIAARWERLHWQVLLGAGVSMYLGWNTGTLLGLAAGPALGAVGGEYLSLVAPLSFVAVLTPLIRSLPASGALLAAGATALVLSGLPPGVMILTAAVTGSLAGSVLAHRSGRGA